MQAGKLRHVLTVEQQQESQDPETGAIRVVWVPVLERIRAEVLPDRASEFFAARQVQSTTNAMIRIRWLPGITAKMRIKHHLRDGPDPLVELWDIQGVVPFQDRFRELRLYCLSREADGFRSDGWVSPTPPPDPGDTITVDSDTVTVDSDIYTVDQDTP